MREPRRRRLGSRLSQGGFESRPRPTSRPRPGAAGRAPRHRWAPRSDREPVLRSRPPRPDTRPARVRPEWSSQCRVRLRRPAPYNSRSWSQPDLEAGSARLVGLARNLATEGLDEALHDGEAKPRAYPPGVASPSERLE